MPVDLTVQRTIQPAPAIGGNFAISAPTLDGIFDVDRDDPELNRLYAQLMFPDRFDKLPRSKQFALLSRLAELDEGVQAAASAVNVTGINEPK